VRHGLRAPERFADWSETIGPVAWRLYGSEWPSGERRRSATPVAKALRQGTLPDLGTAKWGVYRHPWGEYHSAAQLTQDVQAAGRAVELAQELGRPELVQESLAIEGYAQSLQALWELKQTVGPGGVAADEREAAARDFGRFIAGCEQAAAATRAWARLVAPDLEPGGRYWDVAEVLEKSARDMAGVARELDVHPAEPERERR
jgi:hypothetical protein